MTRLLLSMMWWLLVGTVLLTAAAIAFIIWGILWIIQRAVNGPPTPAARGRHLHPVEDPHHDSMKVI